METTRKTNNSVIIAQNEKNVNTQNNTIKEENTMENTKNTINSGFETLLRNFETSLINRDSKPTEYADSLQELGQAIALAVLKKCIQVSSNKALTSIRNGLYNDIHTLRALKYATENANGECYNDKGELIPSNNEFDKILVEVCHTTFSDGMDLVNTAILALLEEADKQEKREGITVEKWLEKPYTTRRIKSKVRIQREDSKGGFEDVEVIPIKEVSRRVRKEIYSNKAVELANNGFTYLEDIAVDEKTGIAETIYRRFGKYADIGGHIKDFNGKETAYIADRQVVEDINTLIGRLELSDRQGEILKLRMCGYGNRAIATYLGISKQAVAKALRGIQGSATSLGLAPVV